MCIVKPMKRLLLLTMLLGCLLLCACGTPDRIPAATEAPAPEEAESTPAPSTTPAPSEEPTTQLVFPNGSVYEGYEISVRLEGLKGSQVSETIALLKQMPNLHNVDLGKKPKTGGLSLNRLSQLMEALPGVDFDYRLTLWDQEISLLDTELDLKYIKMDDEGDLVAHLLRLMPKCKKVDMDSCGVSSEAMGKLREEFPDKEIHWRIWFGKEFSVRTDVERIIAANYLMDDNCADLQYCTKVRLLDIGHNPNLSDISFLAEMPELEVCILAIMPFRDFTPLTNCTKIEYLELCEMTSHKGKVVDLSPIAGMKGLRHLNICKLYEVKNYEFLETFTQLERLWIGQLTYIPKDYIEHLKEVLPDTQINWWTQVSVTEKWREDPPGIFVERYAELRLQFDYWHYDKAASYWWNDPLCKGNDGNLERIARQKEQKK